MLLVFGRTALYDNGTLKRGDKGDYIWKTEQAAHQMVVWDGLVVYHVVAV